MKKPINLSAIINLANEAEGIRRRLAGYNDIARNAKIREELTAELDTKTQQLEQATATLQAAIAEAEGKARERRLTAAEILDAIGTAEEHWGLPKAMLKGIKIRVDVNAQDFPSAYKYTPQSTLFEAECRSGGRWYVTDICRDKCATPNNYITATIPEETLQEIGRRAIEQAQRVKR